MSLAIDVLEPSALLIVCQVLDGALLTRLRGVKPGIGSAANVRFCLVSLGYGTVAKRTFKFWTVLALTRAGAINRHSRTTALHPW
jgi:hypothetical protein